MEKPSSFNFTAKNTAHFTSYDFDPLVEFRKVLCVNLAVWAITSPKWVLQKTRPFPAWWK